MGRDLREQVVNNQEDERSRRSAHTRRLADVVFLHFSGEMIMCSLAVEEGMDKSFPPTPILWSNPLGPSGKSNKKQIRATKL